MGCTFSKPNQGDTPRRSLARFASSPLSAPGFFAGESVQIIHDDRILRDLRKALPRRLHHSGWKVVHAFNTASITTTLSQFYEVSSMYSETYLFVETSLGDVFGAYCNEQWHPVPSATGYYGTGECFLFSIKKNKLHLHKWSGSDISIMSSSSTHLGMGGGKEGFAFYINKDWTTGSSNPCDTFGTTEPLTSEDHFDIVRVELVSFFSKNTHDRV